MKHSLGLHFNCPSDVEDVMSATPEDHRCSKYADYLFENYAMPHLKFPPKMCAEIPSNSKRKNHVAESFHEHFNAQFYNTHPTIFVFLEHRATYTCTCSNIICGNITKWQTEPKGSVPGHYLENLLI